MPTLAGTFPSSSSLKRCAFPSFDRKMEVPNPSEFDIKVLIPAPTYCLHSKQVYSIKRKGINFSLVRKNEIK